MAVVIYSSRTGRIRRIIADPDRTDLELAARFLPGGGESIQLDMALGPLDVMQDALNKLTAKTPADDRYVNVAANGDVGSIAILADPDAGDSIPGFTLVAHAQAREGWRQMRDGTFQRALSDIEQEKAFWVEQKADLEQPDAGTRYEKTQAELDVLIADAESRIQALTVEETNRKATR